MAIYDKIGDTKFGIDPSTFLVDDISFGVNFQPKISIDGKIYSWVDAFNFNKYFSESSYKETTARELEKRKSIEEWVNSLKDTDNPVLIIVTPKE